MPIDDGRIWRGGCCCPSCREKWMREAEELEAAERLWRESTSE